MNYREAFTRATKGRDVREMSPSEIRAAERRAQRDWTSVETATDSDAGGGATLPPSATPHRGRRH